MQTWQTFIQIGPLIFLQLAPAIIPISAELIGRVFDGLEANAERRASATQQRIRAVAATPAQGSI